MNVLLAALRRRSKIVFPSQERPDRLLSPHGTGGVSSEVKRMRCGADLTCLPSANGKNESHSLVPDVPPAPLVLVHVLHGPHGRLTVLAAVAGRWAVRVVQDDITHRQ